MLFTTFRNFSNEMEYISNLLNDDVRNNSAWNQRHFVFMNLKDFSLKALAEELNEIWGFTKFALCNESPWSYLRG